jgi:hypothetical protein
MAAVEIVSFGYLHDAPPTGHLTIDLRPFRDPHVSPELRHMTANDEAVRGAVLGTPGISSLVAATAAGGRGVRGRPVRRRHHRRRRLRRRPAPRPRLRSRSR